MRNYYFSEGEERAGPAYRLVCCYTVSVCHYSVIFMFIKNNVKNLLPFATTVVVASGDSSIQKVGVGGGTLGPRQIEVGPLKTAFERKRVSSKRFATKLKK